MEDQRALQPTGPVSRPLSASESEGAWLLGVPRHLSSTPPAKPLWGFLIHGDFWALTPLSPGL